MKKNKHKNFEVEVGYKHDTFAHMESEDIKKNNFVPKYPIKKIKKFKVI